MQSFILREEHDIQILLCGLGLGESRLYQHLRFERHQMCFCPVGCEKETTHIGGFLIARLINYVYKEIKIDAVWCIDQ